MVRSRIALAILSFAVFAAGAPAMAAQDFCISRSIGGIFVLNNFQPPNAGECRPFYGHMAGEVPVNAMSGSACASPDALHMTFGMTTHIQFQTRFNWILLGSDLTGNASEFILGSLAPTTQPVNYSASAIECPEPTPPAP